MHYCRGLVLLISVLVLFGCGVQPAGKAVETGLAAEAGQAPKTGQAPEAGQAAEAGQAVETGQAPEAGQAASPEEREPQVTLVFVGDLMLARIPGEHIALGEDPFAGLGDLLTGADLAIGNLECVVATVGQRVPKAYNFRCHPQTVPLLASQFDAVSVANNHSGDYGKEAFAEQLQLLEAGSVPYFGGGRNLDAAHSPLVLERNGLKIALLAYNEVELRSYAAGPTTPGLAWLEPDRVERDIRAAREKADLVVVYPHWGLEYQSMQTERQQALAQRWIDLGADLVVGSHPHVIQPMQLYKGRLIAYSLGNFVFDDFKDVPPELDEPSRTSWVLRVTLSRKGLVEWDTLTARTDDRGFPQLLPAAKEPCASGARDEPKRCER